MASPSSSSAYSGYSYPVHPPTGGKGLPPPPPASATVHRNDDDDDDDATSSRLVAPAHLGHVHGNPPDLEKRYKLKERYLKVQKKYFRAIETRKDLTLELAEKEAKVQRLQDEVDLILDQIYDSDYKHLRPRQDNLFSDDDDDEGEVGTGQEGQGFSLKAEPGLEDQEDDRRRELEEAYGIEVAPTPEPTLERIRQDALPDLASSSTPTAPDPSSKRIKLTFGTNGSVKAAAR
ncbi:hypothetical protein JCM10212_003486 [Sporobolomyces blumeae]